MADGLDNRGEGPVTRPGPIGGDTGQRTRIVIPGSVTARNVDEANSGKFPVLTPGHPPKDEE